MVAIDGGEVARGTFLGVDGYGHALVAHADGSVEMHDAADVSLRPDSYDGASTAPMAQQFGARLKRFCLPRLIFFDKWE